MGGTNSFANIIRKPTDWGEQLVNGIGKNQHRTLTHSTRNPEMVYASGINSQGTLFFTASSDFGENWETVEWEESSAGVRVNDMVSVMEEGRVVLYFGTIKECLVIALRSNCRAIFKSSLAVSTNGVNFIG